MIRGTDAMDRVVEAKRGLPRWALALLGGLGALALALLLAWPSLARWSRSDVSVERSQLRIATVSRGDLERDTAVEGRIVAANHPRLFSPAQATVSLAVRAGEAVKAGQTLVRLESPELLSQLAQERARLASLESDLGRRRINGRGRTLANQQALELAGVRLEAAKRELERAERLRGEGLLNQVDYDRAQDAVKVAGVEQAQARSSLEMESESGGFEVTDAERQVERQRLAVSELERRVAELTLVAPFDGIVATIEVEDRDAVQANRPLLTVVDLSAFEVEVKIPESYADDVALGMPAVVYHAGGEIPGEVTAVSPEVSGSQVEGIVAFRGPVPSGLRQSQRVSTRLVFEKKSGVLKVPRGPFLESGAGRLIYVLKDGLATLSPIRIGAVSVSEVEIVEGLAEGDQVLLSDTQQFGGAKTLLVRK